jgi:hypothetical protein
MELIWTPQLSAADVNVLRGFREGLKGIIDQSRVDSEGEIPEAGCA